MIQARFTHTHTYIVLMNIFIKQRQALITGESMHGAVGKSVRICVHADSRQ